jgi:AmiR/NasT family two-component response regulator
MGTLRRDLRSSVWCIFFRSPDVAEIPPLKVLLAHGNAAVRETITEALRRLKHEDIRMGQSGKDLVRQALESPPDLIITGVELAEQDGVSALLEISEQATIPAIIVTQQRSLEVVERALADHVMAYLLEPIQAAEILPTIYLVWLRFEQFEDLRKEVESLKQALGDRKLIERAKGVLMRRANVDEETAYKRLRRMATDHRIRMSEAAERVLSVDTLLEESSSTAAE